MRAARATWTLACVAVGALGCSVPYGAELVERQVNECSSSKDCGSDGVCVSNVCVATKVDLPGLVLEVRPHADAAFGATTSFFFKPGNEAGLVGGSEGGVTAKFSPKLAAPVKITSGQVLPYAAQAPCAITGERLTFYERPELLGLPVNAPIKVTTDGAHAFTAALRPATYDVYIEPQVDAVGCPTPPPVFYPGQVIEEATTSFTRQLPQPSKLTGQIYVPVSVPGSVPGSVTKWVVDVVERRRGARVSTTQELVQQPVAFHVDIDIDFTWREEDDAPLLRLAPPAGEAGPTVYWDLKAVGGSKDNPIVSLSIADLLIKSRTVKPFIMFGTSPAKASLTIQSVALSGEVAKNATFSLDVPETNPDGSVSLALPPGDYAVRVFPHDPRLAVTDATLTVPPLKPGESEDGCVCGKVIAVGEKAILQGIAFTPSGEALVGVNVGTVPSQPGESSFLKDQHFLGPLSARTASATTDELGRFLLEVDPGSSDLTVQPGPGSGFPWLVRPRVTIQQGAKLDALTLTNPAFLSGDVRDPNGLAVGNADVNAWLPLPDPDGDGASTVILIATTATNAGGSYTLVLPSSLTK